MEQLSFLSPADEDVVADAEYPTTYRIERNGMFRVTAVVPGVGSIVTRHRFLWEATVACREKIAAALESAPSSMF